MFDPTQAYGICHLSVAPVRTDPSDKAEIGTQLLFGDLIILLQMAEDKKWIRIKIVADDYEGWIDPKQYQPVSTAYAEDYLSTAHHYSGDLISYIISEKKFIPVLFGSTIPFFNNGMVDLGSTSLQFKGELIKAPHQGSFKVIEKFARNYFGAPYLWGGKCHFGIDCSGLTQQVLKLAGYKLPRDAWQQGETGALIEYEKALPGDLVFFNNPSGRIIHVGILLENNKIIHASGEVRIDRLDQTGIYNEDRKVYSHKLHSIRRHLIS